MCKLTRNLTIHHHLKLYKDQKNLCNNFLSLRVTADWNNTKDSVTQAPKTKIFESRLDQCVIKKNTISHTSVALLLIEDHNMMKLMLRDL